MGESPREKDNERMSFQKTIQSTFCYLTTTKDQKVKKTKTGTKDVFNIPSRQEPDEKDCPGGRHSA